MDTQATKPMLTGQRVGEDLLRVGMAGEWIAKAGLPGFDSVEKGFTSGPQPVKAMEFQTKELGRWNSGLVAFVFKCFELCQQHHAEFRAQTLPAGVSALLQLSQAVPEKKDAARAEEKSPFFERLGLMTIRLSKGATAMVTFVGDSIVSLGKLLRRTAQFRWSDTFLVMQECGPKALGIVALINFLIGLILAFV